MDESWGSGQPPNCDNRLFLYDYSILIENGAKTFDQLSRVNQ
jgi:hypothetical protein